MATKKSDAGSGGMNVKVVMAALGIALISSLSSFVAIRFAMPRQVIIEKHIITERGKVVTEKEEKKAEERPGELYPVGDFIVNLADPGRHYLKTTVQLQLAAEPSANGKEKKGGGEGEGGKDPFAAIRAEMAPYEAMYKDTIIGVLSHQTTARLTAPGGRELVKEELKVALNRLIPSKKVMTIYFTDFVIQ